MEAATTADTTFVSRSDAAKFRELQQRWFMRSTSGTWTAFSLACFTQCIISTPLMGWQTLQQNFLDEGCLYSKLTLDAIDNWAVGLGIAAFLPIGILFDYYGPLVVNVCGMFVGSMGICGIGIALIFPNYLTWLLVPSYILNMVFANMNALGLMVYLWILDEHQNTVTACYQVSDVMATVLVILCIWLTDDFGVTCGAFFLVLGVICLACTVISYHVMPTFEEARLLKKYSQSRKAAQDEENKPSIDDIFGSEETDEHEQGQRFWETVRQQFVDVYWISCLMHPYQHFMFWSNEIVIYMTSVTLTLYQYAYYVSMFGIDEAVFLVDLRTVLFGFVGPFLALCLGITFDRISTECAIVIGNCITLIFLMVVVIPTEGTQIFAMVILPPAFTYARMMALRFSQLYAPPDLFGTFQGCFALFIGCFQVVFATGVNALLSVFVSDIYLRICGQFLGWGGLVAITGLLFGYSLFFIEPLKKPGIATEAELREFQSGTACEKVMEGST